MVIEQRMTFREGFKVIQRLWAFVRPYRSKFYLSILLLLCSIPLAQFALFLTRDVTNKALLATNLTADERWNIVLRIVGLQAIFFLASVILGTFREVLEWYGSMRSTFNLRIAFYKHLHKMPLSFLMKRLPGEHLFRSTADMVSVFRITSRPAVPTASGQSAPDSKEVAMSIYSNDVDPYDPGVMGLIVRSGPLLVETIYSLAWGVALLFLIDPVLSVMLIAYVVPFALISNRLFDKVRESAFTFKKTAEIETGHLRDSLAGMRTLKVFDRLKYHGKIYIESVINTRRAGIRQIADMVYVQNVVQTAMRWTFAMTIFVYVTSRVMQGSATLGDWVAALLLVEAAQGPVENLVQITQLLKVQLVPAQRILETLDAQPAIVDPPNARPMPKVEGQIKFENVQFGYLPDQTVLKGISLGITPKSYVGIVGPSGSGKSSLLALLLRLYQPEQGKITVDGHDVSEVKIASLIEQVGIVPQVTNLFSGTIAENIALAAPRATREDIERAAVAAGVTDFANRFSAGLDTEVGEGVSMSGGEKQRIGIARALLRNPSILLLDEATANLDSETELAILGVIEALKGQVTIVSIAHRLKIVQNCDQIVVLNAGEIAQTGSHDELLAQPGLYRNLWILQSPETKSA